MNRVKNILPYDPTPRVRRVSDRTRLIVLACCFGPTWFGALLIYVLTAGSNPDMWDHEPFSWRWAIYWMITMGTACGLPIYALVLSSILIAGRFGIGPAARS